MAMLSIIFAMFSNLAACYHANICEFGRKPKHWTYCGLMMALREKSGLIGIHRLGTLKVLLQNSVALKSIIDHILLVLEAAIEFTGHCLSQQGLGWTVLY